MTLAQVVLEIFCSQAFIGSQWESRKREIIQSRIEQNFPRFNQVIYTLARICGPNIMTLAEVVLEIFRSQAFIGLQW